MTTTDAPKTGGTHPMLSPLTPQRALKGKIVSAREAVQVIRDGDTIATGGFVGTGFAEEIAVALEEYFLETGKPRDLTLIYAAGQGDGKERGLNHMGHEGLVRRVIGGHWGLVPKLQKLAIRSCRTWWTPTPKWSRDWWSVTIPASPATPRAPSCG